MHYWVWIALLVSSIPAAAIGADIYTWKDAEGRTHYSDRPPAEVPAQTVDLNEQRVSVIGAAALRTAEKDLLGQLEEARMLRQKLKQQQEELKRPISIAVVETEKIDDDDSVRHFFPVFSTTPALIHHQHHRIRPHHKFHRPKKHRIRSPLHRIHDNLRSRSGRSPRF